MKTLKLISAIILLFAANCIAQTKNTKTETVKIYGNCGMCKSTIEKAGNIQKLANVEWNKTTKLATIQYDSLKTSKQEILKRIALVGYDSDFFYAPDDTYASLPGCCQYERAQKEVKSIENVKMTIPELKSEDDNVDSLTPQVVSVSIPDNNLEASEKIAKEMKNQDLKLIFNTYFNIKDALVQSDQKTASMYAKEFLTSIDNVKMNTLEMDVHLTWMKILPAIKKEANLMGSSTDIAMQRKAFISLSESMYQLSKIIKVENPIYYQHCPMANDGKGANWLSQEKEVKNPYYGSAMLTCGKIIETIK